MKKQQSLVPRVPKSWSIHWRFKCAPENHYANMYGFKGEKEMEAVLSYLENNTEVVSLYWTCQWKMTKMGRWMSERKTIR